MVAVLILSHVYRFWQKATHDKLVVMATKKRLFLMMNLKILLIRIQESHQVPR